MVNEMKREERYLVFKIKDAANCLSASEKQQLDVIHQKLNDYRIQNGKPVLKCAVVESDWPEFEPTWQAVSERVDLENGLEVTTNDLRNRINKFVGEISKLVMLLLDKCEEHKEHFADPEINLIYLLEEYNSDFNWRRRLQDVIGDNEFFSPVANSATHFD